MTKLQIPNGFFCEQLSIYCSTLFCLSEMKTPLKVGKETFLEAAYGGFEFLQEMNVLPESCACPDPWKSLIKFSAG